MRDGVSGLEAVGATSLYSSGLEALLVVLIAAFN